MPQTAEAAQPRGLRSIQIQTVTNMVTKLQMTSTAVHRMAHTSRVIPPAQLDLQISLDPPQTLMLLQR
eukprot:COSAG01_NODE_46129_length_402_cov_98.359736_1_plen_67_part_10